MAKLLDDSEFQETPMQLFERMEAKVLEMDDYNAAVIELDLYLSGNNINQKFAALEIDHELEQLQSKAPNNQIFISGSADGIIKFWNFYTGELNYTLKAHSKAISALAIHPDGKIIASSSQDGTIKLWHIQTGELLENLSGFCPLAFSADGKLFISGGKSGTIKIWRQVHNSDDLPPLTGEWWEILGVEPTTHFQDVKLAYRRLARLYHPDINPTVSAKTAIQAVNQAYQKFEQQLNRI